MEQITLTVGSVRAAGLLAKWGRNRAGRPMLLIKAPVAFVFRYPRQNNGGTGVTCLPHQSANWYKVDQGMYDRALVHGWQDAFDGCTLLADMFSI